MNLKNILLIAVVAATPIASSLHANNLATWDFNAPGYVAGNVNSPVTSSGTGTLIMVGMNNDDNRGDLLLTGDRTAWRIRGNTLNGFSTTTQLLSGMEGSVSTVGHSNVVVSFEWWTTTGSSKHGMFQYSTDGVTFTSFGGVQASGGDSLAPAGNLWNPLTFDLSDFAAVNDNADFKFRFLTAFSPVEFTTSDSVVRTANEFFMRADHSEAFPSALVGTSGNWRFDNFQVNASAIPEPSTYAALLGLAVLGLATSRRRR